MILVATQCTVVMITIHFRKPLKYSQIVLVGHSWWFTCWLTTKHSCWTTARIESDSNYSRNRKENKWKQVISNKCLVTHEVGVHVYIYIYPATILYKLCRYHDSHAVGCPLILWGLVLWCNVGSGRARAPRAVVVMVNVSTMGSLPSTKMWGSLLGDWALMQHVGVPPLAGGAHDFYMI